MTAIDPHENPAPRAPAADPPEGDAAPEDMGSAGQEPMAGVPLAARIEALLISSDRPLTEARLGALLGLAGTGVARRVREALEELNGQYEASDRAFRIEPMAGGWQILTQARFGPLLGRLHQDRQQSRLSQAALETLAIVAYRQPIIRAEIEAIRGDSCGEVLRGLLERRLIKIVGRAEELGRPMLYGTTRQFLKVFGLSGLDDLPEVEGIGEEAQRPEAAPDEAQAPAPAQDERGGSPHLGQPPDDEPGREAGAAVASDSAEECSSPPTRGDG
jgi:segregation and condensation protein B